MIDRLLYRCPACDAAHWLEAGRCRRCKVAVRVTDDRGGVVVDGRSAPVRHWYAALRSRPPQPDAAGILLHSRAVALAREARRSAYRGRAGLAGPHFGRTPIGRGRLTLQRRTLTVHTPSGSWELDLGRLTAVTIESNTVIVVSADHGPLFFDFLEESGKRWEDALQAALAHYWQPRRILEFCPRTRFAVGKGPGRSTGGSPCGPLTCRRGVPGGVGPRPAMAALQAAARGLFQGILPLRVVGRQHVPLSGGAVLVANHSSFLDAILLMAFSPRPVWYMTKNSQFNQRFLHGFLPWTGAFPVRRYTTDAAAVRNAVRVVANGELLGLFPEGERSWDDTLLPFKRGALRLLLALGVPVVPVGIAGAYGLMPRWTAGIRRVPVTIRFGRPLNLTPVPASAQTDGQIAALERRLRLTITGLMGQ